MVMRRTVPAWVGAPIGVVCAVLGLLPWLVTGARLPLQNLWATDALPADMPLAALPFSQYYVAEVVAMIGLGAVLAGLFARAAMRTSAAKAGVLAGMVVVQGVAVVQTASVVGAGLADGPDSDLYLAVLEAFAGGAVVVGFAAALVVAFAPRAWALLGLALGAVAAGVWSGSLVGGFGSGGAAETWLPAILVGLAIGWCGLKGPGRVVASVVALGILWLMPAGVTAVRATLSARNQLAEPTIVRTGVLELFSAVTNWPDVGARVAVAALVAGLTMAVLRRVAPPASASPRRAAAAPDEAV